MQFGSKIKTNSSGLFLVNGLWKGLYLQGFLSVLFGGWLGVLFVVSLFVRCYLENIFVI